MVYRKGRRISVWSICGAERTQSPAKWLQTPPLRKPRDSLHPAACSCIRLPGTRDGKEGVDGSSRQRARKSPLARISFRATCAGITPAVAGAIPHGTSCVRSEIDVDHVTLNNGVEMPMLGFGQYRVDDQAWLNRLSPTRSILGSGWSRPRPCTATRTLSGGRSPGYLP
jgi:hypothetical protein